MATANANSSGAVCGSDGIVGVGGVRVARLTEWSFTPTSAESAWGDSDSAGFTNRKNARKDGTGSLAGKLDGVQKPHQDLFMPGDIVDLTLWESGSEYWYVRALITSYSSTFDQDSKEVVSWTADFGADGQYYRPGEAGQPSEDFPT
jgi:hypothetical protein